jgi:hypothetical protein
MINIFIFVLILSSFSRQNPKEKKVSSEFNFDLVLFSDVVVFCLFAKKSIKCESNIKNQDRKQHQKTLAIKSLYFSSAFTF